MSYCTSEAALSRYVQCLAHEESTNNLEIQGVYPRLTRTPITNDMIAGNYKGIIKDEEIAESLQWDRENLRSSQLNGVVLQLGYLLRTSKKDTHMESLGTRIL